MNRITDEKIHGGASSLIMNSNNPPQGGVEGAVGPPSALEMTFPDGTLMTFPDGTIMEYPG